MQVKKDLYSQQKQLEVKVQLLANKAISFFSKNDFTKAHFNNGTFYKHFTENLLNKDAKKWIPSDALLRYINNGQWYAESKSDEIKQLVDFYLKNLQLFMDELLTIMNRVITG